MKSRTASFIAPSPTEMNLGGLKITKKRNFLTLIGSELMHGVYGRRPVVRQGGRKEGGLPPRRRRFIPLSEHKTLFKSEQKKLKVEFVFNKIVF
jgi:hypothetical protein